MDNIKTTIFVDKMIVFFNNIYSNQQASKNSATTTTYRQRKFYWHNKSVSRCVLQFEKAPQTLPEKDKFNLRKHIFYATYSSDKGEGNTDNHNTRDVNKIIKKMKAMPKEQFDILVQDLRAALNQRKSDKIAQTALTDTSSHISYASKNYQHPLVLGKHKQLYQHDHSLYAMYSSDRGEGNTDNHNTRDVNKIIKKIKAMENEEINILVQNLRAALSGYVRDKKFRTTIKNQKDHFEK